MKGEESNPSNAMLIDVMGLKPPIEETEDFNIPQAMIAFETVDGHFEEAYLNNNLKEFQREEIVKSASIVILGKDKKRKKTVLA